MSKEVSKLEDTNTNTFAKNVIWDLLSKTEPGKKCTLEIAKRYTTFVIFNKRGREELVISFKSERKPTAIEFPIAQKNGTYGTVGCEVGEFCTFKSTGTNYISKFEKSKF